MTARRSGRAVAIALLALAAACHSEPPRDLVLVSLDTVRRDHLPTYGYGRDTAPAVDALAKRAVVFWNAFSQDTQTTPSHASMFTGLYPHEHGCAGNGHALRAGVTTLAQVLRAAGFATAGFVGSITMDGELTGFARGFDVYEDESRDDRRTAERALAWLRGRDRAKRFFLLVHFYDAHGPYVPTGEYARLFRSPDPGPRLRHVQPGHVVSDRRGRRLLGLNGYVDRYDEMIRWVDDALAPILGEIDQARTVVVVIADHGETLGERYHQLDHGGQVFDEQIRIPLVVAAPGFPPRRVVRPVETVDLLPTLLELLDVAPPAGLPQRGASLVPLMKGTNEGGRDLVFSSSRCDPSRLEDRGYRLDASRNIYSARTPSWKLIVYPGIERDYTELYDVEADPGETRNVAEENRLLAQALTRYLDDWHAGRTASIPTPDVPPDARERLRQLGYVE